MRLSEDTLRLTKKITGLSPLPTEQGIKFLETFLKTPVTQGVVLYGIPASIQAWVSQKNTTEENKPNTVSSSVDTATLLQKTQELFAGLKKLSEFKHPLDVRRGVGKGVKQRMSSDRQSKQIKGSGRTYFLDLEKTSEGKSYLRITESRKGQGDKFERNSINVFPEDAEPFVKAVSEMAGELGQD